MGIFRKHLDAFVGLGITIVFFCLAILRPGILDRLDLKFYDLMMNLRPASSSATDIILVQIDDESINAIGPWPWPRALLSQGLRKLNGDNPKAIGFDFIPAGPEVDTAVISELKGLEELFTRTVLDKAGETGHGFLEAMAGARNRLEDDRILSEAIREAGNVVIPMGADAPVAVEKESQNGMALTGVRPKERFHDADGILRREKLLYRNQGGYLPSYALALAIRGLGLPPNAIQRSDSGLRIGSIQIPTDPSFGMLINFKGPPGSFKSYSFSDVITDKTPAGVFTNAVVLMIISASGHGSIVQTAMGSMMAEGEFTANIIETIINKAFIRQPPWGFYAIILVLLAIGWMIAFVLPRKGPVISGIICLVIFLAVTGAAIWMFTFRGLWVPTACPMLQLVFGYVGVLALKRHSPEIQKEMTASVSPETNRLLATTFYQEGMLDMAFDKLRLVPVDEEAKKTLYAIGLDYEKRKQFNKALAVYNYIEAHDSRFRDIQNRKRTLLTSSETMVLGDSLSGDGTSGHGIRPLETLGRYRITKEIGRGAMGRVYLGKDPRINRTTAIKTFQFSEDFEPEQVQKMKDTFFREAESAGTLSHANIVTIYDAGEEEGLAYIAMEYLRGESLDKFTKKETLLPLRRVIDYVADIADALHYAHQKGIVHRDIKPANVMLLTNGSIKITDFGIARISATSQTQTGVVKGTPFYMSPEQFSGEKVDGRADIFSLGVMLFQLLTGNLPFSGTRPIELMQKIMKEPHPDPRQFKPKMPIPLVKILDKALEKDRDKRYQNASEMAGDLRELGKKIDEAIARWRAGKKTP